MNEVTLNCGRNGDELCAVRNNKHGCPYYDNEDCNYFVPDSTWTHPSKRKNHDNKARNLIVIGEKYLNGDLDDREFCAMVMAFAFNIMKITPRQAQSMINAIRMDIVSEQLEMVDTDAIIASMNKEEE